MTRELRAFFAVLLGIVIVSDVASVAAQSEANTNRPAAQQHQEVGRQRDISWWTKWVESVKPFSVFGKVIDDSGNPVEGAKVDFHWTDLAVVKFGGEQKSEWLVTDKAGYFSVRIPKGERPIVYGVVKDGYEFKEEYCSYYSARSQDPLLSTSRDNPVVLRLRKKGEDRFLISENNISFQFKNNQTGEALGYDMIRHCLIENLSRLVLNDEPLSCDLQVKAMLNTNDATWAVVLSPGNTNGGIIVSEQLLYEAPDSGYQADYTFTPEDRKPVKAKYIYLKSREPAIYTRLEIEHINANKKFFRLSGKAVTNPYGDRNLEQATDLPYEVSKQLADEAKTSFRQNKRPAKPDLPKMVKEAKEKADKSKQKSP